jgi:hypothetical protein
MNNQTHHVTRKLIKFVESKNSKPINQSKHFPTTKAALMLVEVHSHRHNKVEASVIDMNVTLR